MAPNPLAFIAACFPCLPLGAGGRKQAATASHRSNYYNAQLRSNLGIAERPLRLVYMAGAGGDSQERLVGSYPGNSRSSLGNNNKRSSAGPGGSSTPNPNPRRSAGRGRFPATPGNNGAKPGKLWSDTPMGTAQLAELFDKLATLEHVPYAVCGRAALVDHGLSMRRARQVSILVPAHSKDVVAGWAKSSGWVVVQDNSGSKNKNATAGGEGGAGIFVGIPLATDGSLRQLRVKYLASSSSSSSSSGNGGGDRDGDDNERFDRLERVRSRLRGAGAGAWILGLTSQLDHLAAAWLDHYRRGKASSSSSAAAATAAAGDSKNSHEKPMQEIARDIMWTLDRMASSAPAPTPSSSSKGKCKDKGKEIAAIGGGGSSSNRPDPGLLPTLQSEEFFLPFPGRHAEARPEMARAGIDVGAVLAGLRERRALREHNGLLARYGAAPLPVSRSASTSGYAYDSAPAPASSPAAASVSAPSSHRRQAGREGEGEAEKVEDDDGGENLPFNGIRDLNHRKSVYTVATNLSTSELGLGFGGTGGGAEAVSAAAASAAAAPEVPRVPEPPRPRPRPSTGAAAAATQQREKKKKTENREGSGRPDSSSNSGNATAAAAAGRRQRSVRISEERPRVAVFPARADDDNDGESAAVGRSLTRSVSMRPPPRPASSSNRPVDGPQGRKSTEWI